MKIPEKINNFDYPVNLANIGHYNEQKQFVLDKQPIEHVLIGKINEIIDYLAKNTKKGGDYE